MPQHAHSGSFRSKRYFSASRSPRSGGFDFYRTPSVKRARQQCPGKPSAAGVEAEGASHIPPGNSSGQSAVCRGGSFQLEGPWREERSGSYRKGKKKNIYRLEVIHIIIHHTWYFISHSNTKIVTRILVRAWSREWALIGQSTLTVLFT